MGLFARDGFDPDAWTYIQAVEAADGQPLEVGVSRAIGRFVRGCKDDSIWSAIKASCILAGARTLSGALVPLVGTAPTNFNFVGGDYNRISGLKATNNTKYLDSNIAPNAMPQNSIHFAAYTDSQYIGMIGANTNSNTLYFSYESTNRIRISLNSGSLRSRFGVVNTNIRFLGASRNSSSSINVRQSSFYSATVNQSSTSPSSVNILIFRRPNGFTSNPAVGMQFYSIGESLDLAKLDARVSQLMTDISNALS